MDGLPLTATDFILFAILILSGIFAFVRGFVHELLAIGSWVGAALVTIYAFPHLQPYARELITVELLADMASAVAIFLVVLILLSLVTRAISKRVRGSGLGALDRSLGLVFGLARGAVLVSLAWLLFTWAMPEKDWPTWVAEARTRPLMEEGADMLRAVIPDSYVRRSASATREATDKARELQRQESFRDLVDPLPDRKDPSTQPQYDDQMREEMQRAVEDAVKNPPQGESKR